MPRRLLILLVALAIGGLFAAGLFIDGRVGGGLLLVTAAVLLGLTRAVWDDVDPRRRPIRVAVIAVVVLIAVVKLVQG
jgi:hypothetical protein